MAWSPQARAAAIAARKRKAHGRRPKPKYGVARNGKKMTPAQRKKAGATRAGKRVANRNVAVSKRNARIDKKISKVKSKSYKKAVKRGNKVLRNTYTNADGSAIYMNARGVRHYQKGAKAAVKTQKKIKKLQAKKRKR